MAETVPDVGDTFTETRTWRVRRWRCQPRWLRWPSRQFSDTHSYRVTAWLKRWERPPIDPNLTEREHELLEGLRRHLDSQGLGPQGYGPDNVPLVFCSRDEAEYVSGAGVAGTIARVTDITVTGRVDWESKALDAARDHAHLLIGERVF